jgi:prevent-host-death family protein
MESVSIHEAKAKLSAIIANVRKTGDAVVVCRHGEPVADIVPHRQQVRTVPHEIMSKVQIHYDPTEELSEDEWPESGQ